MAESIFPFFNDFTVEDKTTNFPLYTETAWDFERNVPIFEGGRPKLVTGDEAIKTWCYKAVITPRFRYGIYSWDFGAELEKMIGRSYSPKVVKAEITRIITESLLINPYIRNVSEINANFNNGHLNVDCVIETIYGTVQLSI